MTKSLPHARLALYLAGVSISTLTVHLPAQAPPLVIETADYAARFGDASFEFLPRLGGQTGSTHALGLTLLAVERRNSTGSPVSLPVREVGSALATYTRPGFVERYEVRKEGVELSFVFDSLPAGGGDLVARLRVSTELLPGVERATVSELQFVDALGLGVRVGAVTGIDADGKTSPGTMRFAEGELELALPASFVNGAKLPLTLDPLIGKIYSPVTPGVTDSEPDIAYDEDHDVYLLVFTRRDASTSPSVFGVLMDPDATPVGAPFRIADGEAPKVGNLNASDAFVVAYRRGPSDVLMRSVAAGTGAVSAETPLPPPSIGNWQLSVLDVGDNSSTTVDELPLLFAGFGSGPTGFLHGIAVGVPSSGVPQSRRVFFTALGSPIGFGGNYFTEASLTELATPRGFYLIAMKENWLYTGAELELLMSLAHLNGTAHREWVVPHRRHSAPIGKPLVTGDGIDFVLAYAGAMQKVWLEAGSLAFGPLIPKTWSASSLASVDNSYLAGDGNGIRSVDASTCTPCEGQMTAGSDPVIAGRTTNGAPAGQALVAFGMASGVIGVRAFRADHGLLSGLGGSCGGGRALASCARAGNLHFTLGLRSSTPLTPAWLLLGAAKTLFPCGPCTLVVNPEGALLIPAGNTDTTGRAEVVVPLPPMPALVGVKLIEQWLVAAGSGGCAPYGLAFSNGMEVEIQ